MTDNEINAAIADYVGCEFILDYCNDLNSMHNAEQVLSESQWQDFVDHLVNDWSGSPDPWKEVCHATAKEKAKAFLKTLSKWRED